MLLTVSGGNVDIQAGPHEPMECVCGNIECGAVFHYLRTSCGKATEPNYCPVCGTHRADMAFSDWIEPDPDVCIAGNSAYNGKCGVPGCVCA